jgi:hypothetical protein
MRRLVLLVLIAAVAAVGILYALRRAERTPHATVTTLLPRGTIALAHFPDFNRTRDEWHQSDLYKLYQEPAVQDFLNKPLSRVPQRDTAADAVSEIDPLDLKDAFVAVTSIEKNNPHFVGGFRFRGSQSNAEEIIGKWRSQIVRGASVHESVDYQQHKIDIVGATPNQVATVYNGQWFFASNDLAELKAVLDRADGRDPAIASVAAATGKDKQTTLEADDVFRGAMKHMPASYALLFYLQPKALSEKLTSLRNAIGVSADQSAVVDQIHGVCAATRFDKGKIRDVLFIGMPKAQSEQKLTQSSLALGTSETFLYLATLLNPERLAGINQGGLPVGGWLQKVFDAAARAGMTVDDWEAAFDLELGSLADWPQNSRWPSIFTTLGVKDPVRANKIVNALTHAIDEDVPWTKTEKNGVVYFYMQSPAALFAITPTIALSNQVLIAGLDSVSVESAINRTTKPASRGLADSSAYKSAVRAVPAPTDAFVYVDTALLYSRLDAALRPMLLMSAAFMPAISDYVDVGKLPPPEIVTKHLSPILSSQRYDSDGYVTESTGPVTLDIGLGLPAMLWAIGRHHGH